MALGLANDYVQSAGTEAQVWGPEGQQRRKGVCNLPLLVAFRGLHGVLLEPVRWGRPDERELRSLKLRCGMGSGQREKGAHTGFLNSEESGTGSSHPCAGFSSLYLANTK